MAYDGTAYLGFQRQAKDRPTVQGAIEDALSQVAGRPIVCSSAGRTDTGVHASAQVVAWQMEWSHPTDSLLRAANIHLPPDIAFKAIRLSMPQFHPRFSALSRTYLYRIYIAPARDPLRHRYVWHHFQRLDLSAMSQAAALLEGVHDFATFGSPTQGTSTIRHVFTAEWRSVGDELHFSINANAFLQRMVRSLVGTLVDVGRGKMSIDEFRDAFLAADRQRSGSAAPPQGLSLTAVRYPVDPFADIIQPEMG